MKNRVDKILSRVDELAHQSDQPDGITRLFGSPAMKKANDLLYQWFTEAGLQTRIDNIGNVRGRLITTHPEAKTFVIASHIDSVVNAGKYDGPLGIVMGIDLLEQLKLSAATIPFHIELISFSDEEGVRFYTTYLGSKVVAGSFDNDLLDKKDSHHISLSQAIVEMGGNPALLNDDAIKADNIVGYFEMHIEQGPVLYEANIPVAMVQSIAGQKRISLVFKGESGHAGTVPMNMRRDAMSCAAECIVLIEKYALQNTKVLATVGTLHAQHQASNVIAGHVSCTVDLRSADEDVLEHAFTQLDTAINKVAVLRGIEVDVHVIQSSLPVKCDYHLTYLLRRAIASKNMALKELVSGAGHDAVPMSGICPVAMMFIRCYKGISHHPAENVEPADIEHALAIADQFLLNLIDYYKQE